MEAIGQPPVAHRSMIEFTPASVVEAQQNAALTAEQDAAKAAQLAAMPSLLTYVQARMQEAVQAKQISGITDRLLEAQRRREGRHTPEKKAQLAKYALPDYWVPLTQTKCIQTEAWFRDLLMPYADKIWLLEPTAIPELPEDKAEDIRRKIAVETAELFANGQELTEDEVRQIHDEAFDEEQRHVTEEAKERVKAMERLIQDQHEECDFRGVFRDFQGNLDTYGTAFLYGPFTTVKKMPKWVNGKRTVEKKIIPTCSAPSPHDIFPAPWAKNENDGYIIERIRTYPQGLCDVKELDYYKTAEIDDLLRERDVLTASTQPGDSERNAAEDKQATPPDNRIEIWKFTGPLSGKMLKDWGIGDVDETQEYAVEVQWSANHVIKVMPRWDEVGTTGYFKAVFKSKVGSFWGLGVPELMKPSQDRANSVMIAMIKNFMFAAGVSGWVDLNGVVNPDDVVNFYAGKMVPFRRKPGDNGAPMGFFDIDMRSTELTALYHDCQTDADNESGVPAYMYGSGASGPAGSTYSGLQTLMNASARGIKDALLEVGITISKFVQHWADWNNEYSDDDSVKGDVRVLCTAGVGLFVQELQLSNLDNLINQAVSLAQILGERGYAFIISLLREKAKILKIDVRLLPTEEELKKAVAVSQSAQEQPGQPPSEQLPGAPAAQLLPANTQPGARPEAPAPLPPMEPSAAQPTG